MVDKVKLTEDELLATITHSSIPTILVEGKDDIVFYRRMEEEFGDVEVSMLPAGNKISVLNIKNKIEHLQSLSKQNILIPIVYIIDMDTWVNFGIPSSINFDNLITTKGYSIENDMIEDGDLISLLTKHEKTIFFKEKEKFTHRYALTLYRNKQESTKPNGDVFCYQEHPHRVLESSFFEAETKLMENEMYPDDLFSKINHNWIMELRGKSLLALLLRQLSHKNRKAKYSSYTLMDISASKKGENYMRIVSKLKENLNCSKRRLGQDPTEP